MKNILFLFIISLLFTSCGALTEPKIDFTKPPQQVTKEPPVVRKNKGSLYSVQGTSLFAVKSELYFKESKTVLEPSAFCLI